MFALLYSVGGYESVANSFFALGGDAEISHTVTQSLGVCFCDFKRSVAEFHFAEVHNAVGTVDDEVDL